MGDAELTPLQEMERAAMCGDRQAIIGLVDAVRCYRKAVKTLSSQQYQDGECDAVALSAFFSAAEAIEQGEPI